MQSSKVAVGNRFLDEGNRGGSVGTGEELDHVLGKSGFVENLENEVGRVGRHGRRLP